MNASIPIVCVVLCLLTGCERLVFSESTRYAAGFSERGFKAIKPGMSVNEVTKLLGPPLAVSTQEWCDAWVYSPKTGVQSGRLPARETRFDLFTLSTKVYFGKDGRVRAVTGDLLTGNVVGKDKQQVSATFGHPTSVKNMPFRLILRYALPGKSGTYERREVWLDDQDAVSSKVAELYVD